nr:MAG TPA: hypothetical protein [Caudoviricetes sp.]
MCHFFPPKNFYMLLTTWLIFNILCFKNSKQIS